MLLAPTALRPLGRRQAARLARGSRGRLAVGVRHGRRPQMISAVFFATSENWKGNSAAYILGAALSITAFVTVAYFVARGATSGGGSTRGERSGAVNIVVLVLLG